ncbi:hypothetical protein GXB85_03780 [Cellulomonas sp. APG4]|uniref:hypothetical protein n=1 Tax=Cellulomonas sp. APG4 TaxID=1538656 RepID=UPI00137B5B4D|nr:hypothetical protein [Cellulomonas sp. APG4]NCT90076.1 hypothetical protein [Cellulomonas sp. APG4]
MGAGGVDGRARDRAPAVLLARATAAAGLTTSVSLVAHLLAGGAMPGPLGVGVPLLLATSAGVVLARVRHDVLRLVATVGAGQLLFHLLFTLGAASGAPAAAHGHGHAHGHGTLAVTVPAPVEAVGHAAHTSGTMALAHLAAMVVTVLALRRGEQACARLRALAARTVRLLVRAVGRVPVRPRPVVMTAPVERPWLPSASLLLARCADRRGPPALVAARHA